ncbi:hypothetical protein JYQ62_22135 [Nostoc sp. UHCC 0702]|nr:hypothetical protein JYQ62_22135 [Nostoc sp. UHCC 0702]
MSIILEISSISVEITKFTAPKFPRARIEPLPKLDYSIDGASLGSGPYFEPKYLWTINCNLTPDESILVETIYFEFDYLRRKLQPAEVTLTDKTLRYTERKPRTRDIAVGTDETYIGNTHTAYFAKFKCWFIQPPEFEEKGVYNSASFSLQEADS